MPASLCFTDLLKDRVRHSNSEGHPELLSKLTTMQPLVCPYFILLSVQLNKSTSSSVSYRTKYTMSTCAAKLSGNGLMHLDFNLKNKTFVGLNCENRFIFATYRNQKDAVNTAICNTANGRCRHQTNNEEHRQRKADCII